MSASIRQNRVTQADVRRYAKGVKDAGIAIGRIEILNGKVAIFPADQATGADLSELDTWLKANPNG